MDSLRVGTRLWDCLTLWWMHFFFCKQPLSGRYSTVEPALPTKRDALRPTECEGLTWVILLWTTVNTGNLPNVTYSAGIHWKTKLLLVGYCRFGKMLLVYIYSGLLICFPSKGISNRSKCRSEPCIWVQEQLLLQQHYD